MEIEIFSPGEFEPDQHFYPRAVNAQIHPLVSNFMRMPMGRLVSRYCHLHPAVNPGALTELLTSKPKHLSWSGSDILNVTSEAGVKLKLVIETNSCPSGQKSFPILHDDQEEGGYRRILEGTVLPQIKKVLRTSDKDKILAVLYDKNYMESSGYAQVLANLTGRATYLVPYTEKNAGTFAEIHERELWVLHEGQRLPVACAWRYVTQRPWTRIPFNLKTPIFNPIVACLAGGRNKSTAAKAFEMLNARLRETGLEIATPETFTNVRKEEVPLLVEQLGGRAVVKVPYLNAGQGIYTIVNQEELDSFMKEPVDYEEYVVQQLVGNRNWSSISSKGRLYHIGTMPDKANNIYAFDLRVMVSWFEDRFRPVAMYARRAKKPLESDLPPGKSSRDFLGTNLSYKDTRDTWSTEPARLLMLDSRDFAKLGLGMDDLIDAFIQSVLAHQAIDELAVRLVKRGGGFRRKLFASLNNDAKLLSEIRVDPRSANE